MFVYVEISTEIRCNCGTKVGSNFYHIISSKGSCREPIVIFLNFFSYTRIQSTIAVVGLEGATTVFVCLFVCLFQLKPYVGFMYLAFGSKSSSREPIVVIFLYSFSHTHAFNVPWPAFALEGVTMSFHG